MQFIHATFHQGVFKPVEPVELPEGCQVELQVILPATPTPKPEHDTTDKGGTLQERLAQLAAQVPQHEWNSLPIDISSRIDDYLYGNPEE